MTRCKMHKFSQLLTRPGWTMVVILTTLPKYLNNQKGQWHLSRAYDQTFSSGPRGEQSTMVMGEGRSPGIAHLIKLGEAAKIAKPRIHEIIGQTQTALGQWPALAKEFGVSAANIKLVSGLIGPL